MVVIVQSTAIVAASGVQADTTEVQGGSASNDNLIVQHGAIDIYSNLLQDGGIDGDNQIVAFEGVSQNTQIITPSLIETTVGTKIIVFPRTFSRSAFLAGVIGVTGTIEHFFDRTPFFFTPSEIDPNTIRDISEAQQFLIFSSVNIASYSIFTNTVGTTKIVTDKGEEGIDANLLKTSNLAHVLTIHPILDELPFTISGSDDITQQDLSAPYFDETSPASGTTTAPADSDLQFHIKDVSSALDQGTINVRVDGVQVVSVGSTVTGTTWPSASKTVLAPNDIEYVFQRGTPFTSGAVVTVSGEFADLADVSNYAEQTYQFKVVGSGGLGAAITGDLDATPPIITPITPGAGATQVSPNTEVRWTLTDDASGVDPSTVRLLLNGAAKIENGIASGGTFSRTANGYRGFNYNYVPATPFDFGSTVTGSIVAADYDGNSDSLDYEFTITSANTLEIQNFFLGLNESTLLTSGTELGVEIVDFTYGVASGTSSLTINGSEPVGLITTFSGVGPTRIVYSLPLEPLVDFREDLTVVVHAENQFPGSFPVVKETQYTLQPGYAVTWPNKEEGEGSAPETIFPYLTNIQVLTEVKNFAKTFGEASFFSRFLIEEQHTKDLGATIISNIQTHDLSASLNVLNPFFEYGKTITLEIEADDLEGNQFRLTHIFTIESRP